MEVGFLISWLLNFFIIAIVLALIDQQRRYGLEKKPGVLFMAAVLLPTLLELFAFVLADGQPFMTLVLPIEHWGWLFSSI